LIKLLRVVLASFASVFVVVLAVSACPAQQPAPQPLTEMPYSPSLDLTSMDRSVDPCVNFYQYVCGGWKTLNPIPADQATWDVYAKLANENQQFLWGILEQDAKAMDRTPIQQKVGDYFESCMNREAINAEGDRPIQPALARIDALSTRPELLAAITQLHHDAPGSYFFRSGTGQDAVDSSVVIAELGAGGLGLPDRDYYLKTDAKSVKLREQYADYIAQLLTLSGEPVAQAHTDAASILHIETELARASLTRVQERDPHNLYHMMPIADVEKLAPVINWADYFKQQGAPGLATLNVSQPAFLKALQAELSTEDVAALRAYLRFHLLSGMASYLAGPFEQAYYGFYYTTLRGVPSMPPRWKTCTRAVDRNLGEALGQEFVHRTFSKETKAKTELMTQQIEAAMQQEIEVLDWMSPASKQEALRKLHAIRNKIGYPDHWRDYAALEVKPNDYAGDVVRAYRFSQDYEWNKLGKPVDRNEWGMTPPTVNAYFNPQMNDINFPAGVLQPPLYDPKLDDAPNYGNTGATIGHELTHAFDDEGRQFDSKGNLRDWWTPDDAKGFEERIGCVREQYAGYVIVDDIHINSKLTSGEDVADLGGTLLAYIAWKKETAGERLPNKDGFTPDQRFFIGMAQWACSNERPENERVQAATDPHSPSFARINGVVSNLPQFQKAFACKAGQPMVHEPNCKVW
jgi:putative endopeptidase